MAEILINQIKNSGLSNYSVDYKNISIESKSFAGGGFGNLHKCQKLDGKASSELIVKILINDQKGTHQKCLKTVESLQNIMLTYSPSPDSLMKDYTGLKALPILSFKGKLMGKDTVGYVQFFLKDFMDFDEIISTKYQVYKQQPVVARLRYALKLVQAMDFLYKNKVIHSDINPSNLFIKLNTEELILLDLDSGCVIGKSEATTFGKIGDFLAPEIMSQIIQAQKVNKVPTPKGTLESDLWAVGVAISYLIFVRHPLCIFKAINQNTYSEYKSKFTWPDFNPSESYINKNSIKYFEEVVIKVLNHPAFKELKQLFSKLINDGYDDPDKRPSSENWINAIQFAIDSLQVSVSSLIKKLEELINRISSIESKLMNLQPSIQFLNITATEFQIVNTALSNLKKDTENQSKNLSAIPASNQPNLNSALDKYNDFVKRCDELDTKISKWQTDLLLIITKTKNLETNFQTQLKILDTTYQILYSVKDCVDLPGLLTAKDFSDFEARISSLRNETDAQISTLINSKKANLPINLTLEIDASQKRDARITLVSNEINNVKANIDSYLSNLRDNLIDEINKTLNVIKSLQPGSIDTLIKSIKSQIDKLLEDCKQTEQILLQFKKECSFAPTIQTIIRLINESRILTSGIEKLSAELNLMIGVKGQSNFAPFEKDFKSLIDQTKKIVIGPVLISIRSEYDNIYTKMMQLPNAGIIDVHMKIEKLSTQLNNLKASIPSNTGTRQNPFNWSDIVNPKELVYKLINKKYFYSIDVKGNLNGLVQFANNVFSKTIKRLIIKNRKINAKQEHNRRRIEHLEIEKNKMLTFIGGPGNLLTEKELLHIRKIIRGHNLWIVLLLIAETALAFISLEAIFPPSNPYYRGLMFSIVRFTLSFVSTFGLMLFIDKLFLAIWPLKPAPLKARLPIIIILGLFSGFVMVFIIGLAYMRSFNYEKNLPVFVGLGFVFLSIALPILAAYLKFLIDKIEFYHETRKYNRIAKKVNCISLKQSKIQSKEEAIFEIAVANAWQKINNMKTQKTDGDSSLENTEFETHTSFRVAMESKYNKLKP